MRRNTSKAALYESIMRNVSTAVNEALNGKGQNKIPMVMCKYDRKNVVMLNKEIDKVTVKYGSLTIDILLDGVFDGDTRYITDDNGNEWYLPEEGVKVHDGYSDSFILTDDNGNLKSAHMEYPTVEDILSNPDLIEDSMEYGIEMGELYDTDLEEWFESFQNTENGSDLGYVFVEGLFFSGDVKIIYE